MRAKKRDICSAYINSSRAKTFREIILGHQKRYFRKITLLSYRRNEIIEKERQSPIDKLQLVYYTWRQNRLAPKRNVWVLGKIGFGTRIYHGNVIVNSHAKVGDGVIFHGNNCIGNNGKEDECPTIGNNVDMGYGSTVIGKINIADGTIIGANSVVTKSFTEGGEVVAGCPAKTIRGKH